MDEILTLKLDKMNNDYPLAKAYFKKHNHMFFRGDNLKSEYVLDNCQNKIYLRQLKKFGNSNNNKNMKNAIDALVGKIKDNAELFSELECMLRGRPMDNVLKSDLKLLTQFLIYCSDVREHSFSTYGLESKINDDMPIAKLGYSIFHDDYIITTTPNSAAICHLFAELCEEAGLSKKVIVWQQVDDQDWSESFDRGCLGVVTEKSDADSAVDALLASSAKYPWSVRRILIQESVYESVLKTLQWKCQLKGCEVDVDADTRKLCAEVLAYGERALLVGAGGAADAGRGGVLVDAYRTTKELLALLAQHRPWCMSLWCTDLSEAHEISFASSPDVSIVWVNEHAAFEGPARASLGFYTNFKYVKIHKCENYEKVLKMRKSWVKLSFSERIKIIQKSIASYETETSKTDSTLQKLKSVDFNAIENEWGKFVTLEGGRLCVGVPHPHELMIRHTEDSKLLLYALVGGSAILYGSRDIFVNILNRNGVPIIETKVPIFCPEYQYFFKSKLKIIQQNFGTIFAN